ncbi:MAG: four helix bundle protein [Candidatus Pacebacteria bacterium]|nr:four helix bundle protein [Candidatus Paceibacterota bacterium]MDR3583293.1 four helix bundle protein [Candidatus Paceibacterota bacterium]
MARYNHLLVFQRSYDLNLEIYRTTHNFPREYKYSLGQKMKEISAELLDWIVVTNSQKDKTPYFSKIKMQIERLRIQIRVAYDLKIIKSQRLEFLNRIIEEISMQVSGWENWAKTQDAKA